MYILQSSTHFEQYYAHPQEVSRINTTSGVVTLCKWLACAQASHLQRVTTPDAVFIQLISSG
jgi:hypothetical protein